MNCDHCTQINRRTFLGRGIAGVGLLGLNSLLTMPRQSTPTISVFQAIVAVPYPGATAAEVEQQVTRPLEQYLFSFTEVDAKKTKSVTRDGVTIVTVELNEWVKDQKAFWSRPSDVKAMFGASVDFVGDRLVFDVGGNKYRLVVHVAYAYKRVLIKFIGTHAEYDRIDVRTI